MRSRMATRVPGCKLCETMFPPLKDQRSRKPWKTEASSCPIVAARVKVKLCCLYVFLENRTANESRKPRVFLSTVSMSLSWGTQHQDLDWLRYVGELTWNSSYVRRSAWKSLRSDFLLQNFLRYQCTISEPKRSEVALSASRKTHHHLPWYCLVIVHQSHIQNIEF